MTLGGDYECKEDHDSQSHGDRDAGSGGVKREKDLSKTALVRQALRMYQVVEARLERGDKLFFENDQTKEKAEVMML